MPIFATSAYLGVRLYEKLVGHYLNLVDHDVSHDFKINYEARYKLYEEGKKEETKDFSLKQFRSTKVIAPHERSEMKYAWVSQIRNLENIVFVDDADLNKVRSQIELQVLIDSVSVKPTALSAEEKVKRLQKKVEKVKLLVESSRFLESDKEKMLGLPFLMHRLKQFPEPERGTWQYDLFEELFGVPYDLGKNEFETEEKIHKHNYHQFLHPSIIEKFNDSKLII